MNYTELCVSLINC